MTQVYDEFGQAFSLAHSFRILSRDLVSKDPNKVGNARARLEDLINNPQHPGAIGPDTVVSTDADSSVLSFVPVQIENYESIGTERFARNPNALIEEGRNSSGNKFQERYLNTPPTEISGNDAHNRIVEAHKPFHNLRSKLQEYIGSDQKDTERGNFTNETADIYADALKQRLSMDPGHSEDAVKRMAALAKDRYFAHPELVARKANYALALLADVINKAVPESEKAAYAERNLRAKAAEGGDSLREAAKALFEITA